MLQQLSFDTPTPAGAATPAQPTPADSSPAATPCKPEAAAQSAPAARYYSINETAARRANDANSFYDYKPGSATAEYRRMVDEAAALAEQQKRRTDPMYHDKIDTLLDAYARKLAANLNASFAINARVASVLIAGPANFPARKKEKQNAARDRNMEEYRQIEGLLDKIRSTGTGGISADDPEAVHKLEAKLAALERSQERMKAANAALRIKDAAKSNARLAGMGYTPDEIRQLREPDFAGRTGYPAYMLSNNNANMRRIRQRIEQLKMQRAAAPAGDTEFDGGRIVRNTEQNRLQIFFDEKPNDDTRAALKSNGFRWSPRNNAWQRQLTPNAERAARQALNLTT